MKRDQECAVGVEGVRHADWLGARPGDPVRRRRTGTLTGAPLAFWVRAKSRTVPDRSHRFCGRGHDLTATVAQSPFTQSLRLHLCVHFDVSLPWSMLAHRLHRVAWLTEPDAVFPGANRLRPSLRVALSLLGHASTMLALAAIVAQPRSSHVWS